MLARTRSTLPLNRWGGGGALSPAASAAIRAASIIPSPRMAEISATGQPRAWLSFRASSMSPFLRTTSIMFTAATTGMPSSSSWVVR